MLSRWRETIRNQSNEESKIRVIRKKLMEWEGKHSQNGRNQWSEPRSWERSHTQDGLCELGKELKSQESNYEERLAILRGEQVILETDMAWFQ